MNKKRVAFWSVATLLIGAVAFVVLGMKTGVIPIYVIASPSMEPTLMVGDYVLVNGTAEIELFDIIAFRDPDNEAALPYIKRVVGLGGDEVRIDHGILYINGKDQYSTSVSSNIVNWPNVRVKVPAGAYFVLGDNRNDSHDSLDFGPIGFELVIGVADKILWPRSRYGPVKNFTDL